MSGPTRLIQPNLPKRAASRTRALPPAARAAAVAVSPCAKTDRQSPSATAAAATSTSTPVPAPTRTLSPMGSIMPPGPWGTGRHEGVGYLTSDLVTRSTPIASGSTSQMPAVTPSWAIASPFMLVVS